MALLTCEKLVGWCLCVCSWFFCLCAVHAAPSFVGRKYQRKWREQSTSRRNPLRLRDQHMRQDPHPLMRPDSKTYPEFSQQILGSSEPAVLVVPYDVMRV